MSSVIDKASTHAVALTEGVSDRWTILCKWLNSFCAFNINKKVDLD
jgi:hypothetical protein